MDSLNYLGVNRYVLVGHSMGGYLSLAIASLFPERVEKLILFDAAYTNHSESLNGLNLPFELGNENQVKLYQVLLDIGLKTYPLVKFLYQTSLSTGSILSTEHFEYLFAQNYFLPAEVLLN
ncbi:alpha/beta fold hydrolase [Fervidobacterium pennivorans subsp. shakshaketiis]|jgi:pimeloyl-ACP methyl ester carboxylesterase|uniref:alpha/beta fold hydrolase n=1 Tax=Fervidobacterium pennivorans TaxID=93466 RepID=UPI000234C961|nr:alpha/beta fold hydrolase [Fervidobacterium pennivorans]QIV78109.1 alpha/beta fold hydrolase [Fervidobacterium pennivorans subsp. keratinolyticus]